MVVCGGGGDGNFSCWTIKLIENFPRLPLLSNGLGVVTYPVMINELYWWCSQVCECTLPPWGCVQVLLQPSFIIPEAVPRITVSCWCSVITASTTCHCVWQCCMTEHSGTVIRRPAWLVLDKTPSSHCDGAVGTHTWCALRKRLPIHSLAQPVTA